MGRIFMGDSKIASMEFILINSCWNCPIVTFIWALFNERKIYGMDYDAY